MTRVLVVDDSESITAVIDLSLGAIGGLDVLVVNSDFTSLLNPHDPRWEQVGLLVCDLMLPGLSGLDIMAACRRHLPHIEVIAMTGAESGTFEEVRVARTLADHFIAKPSDIDHLTELAVGIMRRRAASRGDSGPSDAGG